MSKGELYRKILEKRDGVCHCGGDVADETNPEYRPIKTCKIKREPTKDEIRVTLDEAAKEYPRYEDYHKFSNSNSHTHGCPIHDWNADPNQNHCSCPKRGRDYEKDREQWFIKYFGDAQK